MRPKHECVNHLGWLCVVSSCLIALAGHVWTRVETLVPMYPIYLLHLLTAVKAKELMLFACPKILIDQFLLEEMAFATIQASHNAHPAHSIALIVFNSQVFLQEFSIHC